MWRVSVRVRSERCLENIAVTFDTCWRKMRKLRRYGSLLVQTRNRPETCNIQTQLECRFYFFTSVFRGSVFCLGSVEYPGYYRQLVGILVRGTDPSQCHCLHNHSDRYAYFHGPSRPRTHSLGDRAAIIHNFYALLTLHLSTILVNDQIDVQFFYFMIHLLQSSTCFEQRRAHHHEIKLY